MIRAESSRWQSFWALIGQIGTLVALLVGVTGLFIDFSKPTSGIVTEVEPNNIHWPDSEGALVLADVIEEHEVYDIFDDLRPERYSDQRPFDDARDKVKNALLRYLKTERVYGNIHKISGCWKLKVKNEGDLIAKDVLLVVPNAVEVHIERGGKKGRLQAESIPLGSIRPRESISILAWTSTELNSWNVDDIALSHSSGLGEVRLSGWLAPTPESPWPLVGGTTILVVLLISAFFRFERRNIRKLFRRNPELGLNSIESSPSPGAAADG